MGKSLKAANRFAASMYAKSLLGALRHISNHLQELTCGFIRATAPGGAGFASLAEYFRSDHYAGKRVRFSAYLKTENASSAQLWFRVDVSSNTILSFDNMQYRPVRRTTDWTKYSCVLDVPPQSSKIMCGVLLVSSGQVWIDDAQFEVVGTDVPVTGSTLQ